jgi:hypothetical protein
MQGAKKLRPEPVVRPVTGAALQDEGLRAAFLDNQTCDSGERRLHGLLVKLAVGLRARPPNGGTLAAMRSRNWIPAARPTAAHIAVERHRFPARMAFAQSADGRIAGHLAYRRMLVVSSSVRAPARAAAAAASQPAWPPSNYDDVEPWSCGLV